jgi:hypothetical protein
MPAHAIALKWGHRPEQAGMQAHAVQLAHRHIIALGIGRRVAGMRDLMPVDRPHRTLLRSCTSGKAASQSRGAR